MVTAHLGVSRRADAWDEQDQAYFRDALSANLSIRQAYRIGPERDSQVGCRQMGLFQRAA